MSAIGCGNKKKQYKGDNCQANPRKQQNIEKTIGGKKHQRVFHLANKCKYNYFKYKEKGKEDKKLKEQRKKIRSQTMNFFLGLRI